MSLHFNSDPAGGDVVVITGEASSSDEQSMLQFPDFVEKYNDEITGALGTTADAAAPTTYASAFTPPAYD